MKRCTFSLALAASLALASPAFADVPINDAARGHFKAGVSLLQDPSGARYEEAYREFRAAYAESPSPRILGNMGLTAMKLERDGEAIEALQGYLAGVPDMSPDEKRQVTTDLATIKDSTYVEITVNVPNATIIDVRHPVQGNAVRNTYGPLKGPTTLRLRPGSHTLTARAVGYADAAFELEAAVASKVQHTFTLESSAKAPTKDTAGPAVEKTRPVPTAVFIVGGATIAAAAGGAVVGVLALGKNSEFKDANDGSNPGKADDLRSSGQTLNLIADILFGTAVVGAGVTTYLYVARPTVEMPRREGGLESLRFDVGGLPSGGAVRLSGAF